MGQKAWLAVALAALASGCFLDRAPLDGRRDAAQLDDAGISDAGVSDAGEGCGDGIRQAPEECDGTDVGGASCSDLGLPDGPLACTVVCTLLTSSCTGVCGNGRIEPPEQCEGADLGGGTCEGLGLSGELGCTSECRFDRAACAGCGNGRVEEGELCDTDALSGRACTGRLSCDAACRYDATACTWPSAGDARDGDLVVDAHVDLPDVTNAVDYVVTAIDVGRVTLDADAGGLVPGDLALLISVQGSTAACSSSGAHEIVEVASVDGPRVVLTSAVVGTYGVGGNADLSGQRVILQRVPQLGTVTVTPTGHLDVPAWDGTRGGVLAFFARSLVLEAGGRIDADGEGYRGGPGQGAGRHHGRRGESTCDSSMPESTVPADGAGGGGRFVDPGDGCGQGGGGAGYGTAGTQRGYPSECVRVGVTGPADNAGATYGSAVLDRLHFGAGGGGGASDDHSSASGGGGQGGGIVLIHAARAQIDGDIIASGADGQLAGDTDDAGNGGGGAGGSVVLRAGRLDGAGRIIATGGRGPESATNWNGAGGDGGDGRIRVDFAIAGGSPFGSPEGSSYASRLWGTATVYSEIYID